MHAKSEISPARKIVASIAGNVLEWYDFAVYGFVAPIIAIRFFPADNPTSSLLATFGAFAIGYLMRPIGAILFGHFSDRIGREYALLLSVAMIAVPTVMIGILPTYSEIGIWAGILLTLLRMLQGLAVGGEFSSSITYLSEIAPNERRGFFGSWAMFGAWGGILLGSGVGVAITTLLGDDDLSAWGWRIPFLLGLLFGVAGIYLRLVFRRETSVDREFGDLPIKLTLRNHRRNVLRAIGLLCAGSVVFYLSFVYVITWLVDYVEQPHDRAFELNSAALILLIALGPLAGYLSDLWGRRTVLASAAGGIVIFSYPLFWLMDHPDPLLILAGQCGMAVLTAFVVAPTPAALSELFPRQVRATALGTGYNISVAFFGGLAPMIAVSLIDLTHDELSFAWYAIAAAAVTFFTALGLKDCRGKPLD